MKMAMGIGLSNTPTQKKFDGKVYLLTVMRAPKGVAIKEANKLRKSIPGLLCRLWRHSNGTYSVYSR